ncbi:MAG: MFS transporter [Patescibacteria group bacterium]
MHFIKKNKPLWMLVAGIAIFAGILCIGLPALAGGVVEAKPWYTGFTPIVILLVVVIFIISRLKKPEGLAHLQNKKYINRRVLNWVALGITYAFLYWGRYNLQPAIQAIDPKDVVASFNWVFGVGTFTYGFSFLINGPLTDRKGGRFAIIVGATGAAVANILMGIVAWANINGHISDNGLFWGLMIIYPINMYFQSFGAVAIVKVNSHWFHVNERGTFGAIFGILISLGVYFAFDWSYAITGFTTANWAFVIPGIFLALMVVVNYYIVRDTPSDAKLININTDDASAGDDSPLLPAIAVFKTMLKNPVIVMIACIEFCSGFLRQAIMQMYRFFAKATDATLHLKDDFVYENWGMCLCIAGILGGVFAGTISDRVFKSRRAPVAAVLYAFMLAGSIGMFFLLDSPVLGWLMIFMSMSIIGVHGMLSGTASQDFGGTKNVGVAVGIIDGFVYAGTGAQAIFYKFTLPQEGSGIEAADLSNWIAWPSAMIPLAAIGLVLAFIIRNEKPKSQKEKAEAKAAEADKSTT